MDKSHQQLRTPAIFRELCPHQGIEIRLYIPENKPRDGDKWNIHFCPPMKLLMKPSRENLLGKFRISSIESQNRMRMRNNS